MKTLTFIFLGPLLSFGLCLHEPDSPEGVAPVRAAMAGDKISGDCKYNGIPLYGKVKVVENFADIKVEVVNSFPDLKVKTVTSFPDDCGEWQFVESFPDFTVTFVESFGDIKIKYVESFPGQP